jgi:hypothetical protein
MLGIRLSSTPLYNPKSNPVERQLCSLGDAIKALTEGDQRAWETTFLMPCLQCVRPSASQREWRLSLPCLEEMHQRLWRWSSGAGFTN